MVITRIKPYQVNILGNIEQRELVVIFNADGEVVIQNGSKEFSLDFGFLRQVLPKQVTYSLLENENEVYYRGEKGSFWIEIGIDFNYYSDKRLKWFIRGHLPDSYTVKIPLRKFKYVKQVLNKLYFSEIENLDDDVKHWIFYIDFSDIKDIFSFDKENKSIVITLPKDFNIDPVIISGSSYLLPYTNQNFFFALNDYYYIFFTNKDTDRVHYAYSTDMENWTTEYFSDIDLMGGYGYEISTMATNQKIFLVTIEGGFVVKVRVISQNDDGSLDIDKTITIADEYTIIDYPVLTVGKDNKPYLVYIMKTDDSKLYLKAFRSTSSSDWIEDTDFTLNLDVTDYAYKYDRYDITISGNNQYAMIVFTNKNTSKAYYIRYDDGTWSDIILLFDGRETTFPSILWEGNTEIYVFLCHTIILMWIYDIESDTFDGYYIVGSLSVGGTYRTGRFCCDNDISKIIGYDILYTPKMYYSEWDTVEKPDEASETLMDNNELSYSFAYKYNNTFAIFDTGYIYNVYWNDSSINIYSYQYKTVSGGNEYTINISDNILLYETTVKWVDLYNTILNTLSISEGKADTISLTLEDVFTLNELVYYSVTLNQLLQETLTLQEWTNLGGAIFTQLITDVIDLTEQSGLLLGVNLQDDIFIIEDKLSKINSMLKEDINLTESKEYKKVLLALLSDIIALNEITQKIYTGFMKESESVNLSEKQSKRLEMVLLSILNVSENLLKTIGIQFEDNLTLTEVYNTALLTSIITDVLLNETVSGGVKAQLLSILGLNEDLISLKQGVVFAHDIKEIYSLIIFTKLLNSDITTIKKLYSIIQREVELFK